MRAFIFEYFDGITGEQEIFTDEKKAVTEYDYTLDHMTERGKKNLEYFHLIEIEATAEQMQDIQENGYNEDMGAKWVRDIKSYKYND